LNIWDIFQSSLCSGEPQVFANNTIWRGTDGAFFGDVAGTVQFYGMKFIDNAGTDFRWYHMGCGPNLFDWRPQVKDALFVSSLHTPYSPTGAKIALAGPNIEFFYVSGATFVDYTDGIPLTPCVPAGCICLPVFDQLVDYQLQGYTYRTDRLKFINSPQVSTISSLYFMIGSLSA
jgi:hypothetical protein